MRTNHLIPVFAVTAIIAIGCNKDGDGGGAPESTSSSDLRDLFETHVAQATQTFTINVASGGQVTGSKGTILTFQPNAFHFASGALATGTVEVGLVEGLDIGDMIWLNKQTVGNYGGTTRMLRSGGELRITAAQGGQELELVPGRLSVRVPTTSPDPNMALFTASRVADSSIVWTAVDSAQVDSAYDNGFYYEFTADSMHWINCDYFYNYPNTTNLTASLPGGEPHDSTMVWIAFPSENAVMNMYYQGSNYNTTQVVPVGMTATVVGLARINGQYSSAFSAVSITNGMNVPLTFQPTTLGAFQVAIDAL